jgi:hypothetical protein
LAAHGKLTVSFIPQTITRTQSSKIVLTMSRSKTLTLNGETLTIPQWAKRLNLTANTIRYRIRTGWPLEQALTIPHSGLGRPIYADRVKVHQRRKSAAELLARDFARMVEEIDHALRKFKGRLGTLSGQTPGVVESIDEQPFDRATPSTQDSV